MSKEVGEMGQSRKVGQVGVSARNEGALSRHRAALRELPAEVPAAAAHSALNKALNSTLNAVPPAPCFPLLLGFAVDQRMSSVKSLPRAL